MFDSSAGDESTVPEDISSHLLVTFDSALSVCPSTGLSQPPPLVRDKTDRTRTQPRIINHIRYATRGHHCVVH